MFVEKSNNRMSGLWFPPNHANGERQLAPTVYPSCAKPHTRYATNTRGPTFILVTHLALKMKLTTFLNECGKISPLSFEGQISTQVTEGVRVIQHFIGMMEIQ